MSKNIPIQDKAFDICPHCKSNKNKVYAISKETDTVNVRYHRCKDCGKTFKTIG